MKYSKGEQPKLFTDVSKFFEKLPDGKLDIVRAEDRRTVNQQSLLHVLIREISNSVGCGFDELKDNVLKRNSEGVFPFWPVDLQATIPDHLKKERPEVLQVLPGYPPKSESKLTKDEESELIERLYQLGAEWSVNFEKVA